jgi:hypothetical protein
VSQSQVQLACASSPLYAYFSCQESFALQGVSTGVDMLSAGLLLASGSTGVRGPSNLPLAANWSALFSNNAPLATSLLNAQVLSSASDEFWTGFDGNGSLVDQGDCGASASNPSRPLTTPVGACRRLHQRLWHWFVWRREFFAGVFASRPRLRVRNTSQINLRVRQRRVPAHVVAHHAGAHASHWHALPIPFECAFHLDPDFLALGLPFLVPHHDGD